MSLPYAVFLLPVIDGTARNYGSSQAEVKLRLQVYAEGKPGAKIEALHGPAAVANLQPTQLRKRDFTTTANRPATPTDDTANTDKVRPTAVRDARAERAHDFRLEFFRRQTKPTPASEHH